MITFLEKMKFLFLSFAVYATVSEAQLLSSFNLIDSISQSALIAPLVDTTTRVLHAFGQNGIYEPILPRLISSNPKTESPPSTNFKQRENVPSEIKNAKTKSTLFPGLHDTRTPQALQPTVSSNSLLSKLTDFSSNLFSIATIEATQKFAKQAAALLRTQADLIPEIRDILTLSSTANTLPYARTRNLQSHKYDNKTTSLLPIDPILLQISYFKQYKSITACTEFSLSDFIMELYLYNYKASDLSTIETDKYKEDSYIEMISEIESILRLEIKSENLEYKKYNAFFTTKLLDIIDKESTKEVIAMTIYAEFINLEFFLLYQVITGETKTEHQTLCTTLNYCRKNTFVNFSKTECSRRPLTRFDQGYFDNKIPELFNYDAIHKLLNASQAISVYTDLLLLIYSEGYIHSLQLGITKIAEIIRMILENPIVGPYWFFLSLGLSLQRQSLIRMKLAYTLTRKQTEIVTESILDIELILNELYDSESNTDTALLYKTCQVLLNLEHIGDTPLETKATLHSLDKSPTFLNMYFDTEDVFQIMQNIKPSETETEIKKDEKGMHGNLSYNEKVENLFSAPKFDQTVEKMFQDVIPEHQKSTKQFHDEKNFNDTNDNFPLAESSNCTENMSQTVDCLDSTEKPFSLSSVNSTDTIKSNWYNRHMNILLLRTWDSLLLYEFDIFEILHSITNKASDMKLSLEIQFINENANSIGINKFHFALKAAALDTIINLVPYITKHLLNLSIESLNEFHKTDYMALIMPKTKIPPTDLCRLHHNFFHFNNSYNMLIAKSLQ